MNSKKAIASGILASIFLVACSQSGNVDEQMIPPTAGGAPLAPIQVPAYPPIGYNPNPSLLAGSPVHPNSGFINNPTVAPFPQSQPQQYQQRPVDNTRYNYTPTSRFDDRDVRNFDDGYARSVSAAQNDIRRAPPVTGAGEESNIIPNSPILTPNNVVELSAVGMGVAPESAISPSQALALAKRAAIVDAYRQLGEKMYGVRLNASDTVRDAVLQNTTVKTRVQAIIKNAEITETVYKDGLCQVSMELKLDGRIWHRALNIG